MHGSCVAVVRGVVSTVFVVGETVDKMLRERWVDAASTLLVRIGDSFILNMMIIKIELDMLHFPILVITINQSQSVHDRYCVLKC